MEENHWGSSRDSGRGGGKSEMGGWWEPQISCAAGRWRQPVGVGGGGGGRKAQAAALTELGMDQRCLARSREDSSSDGKMVECPRERAIIRMEAVEPLRSVGPC